MDRKYSEPQPSDRGVAHEHREANPGEPFNPWHEACGFYPQDVLGRQRKLLDATGNLKMVTAGQKRLYERLVRFAGKDGRCFPSQDTLARELGRSDRQVRKDLASLESFKLLRHTWRDGRRNNNYEFLWHPIFDNRNHRSAQVSESSPSERNSSSAQTESDGAVDRNPNTAQPYN